MKKENFNKEIIEGLKKRAENLIADIVTIAKKLNKVGEGQKEEDGRPI